MRALKALICLGCEYAGTTRVGGRRVRLAEHHYALVLLDISMPGMNGLEVCQHIRADARFRELRVIAYTAHVLLEEQQRFLAGGFDDVLLKPTSLQAVRELIRTQIPCA